MADKGNGLLKGLFIGGLLGVAAGILLAPTDGRKTRTALQETGGKVLEEVRRSWEDGSPSAVTTLLEEVGSGLRRLGDLWEKERILVARSVKEGEQARHEEAEHWQKEWDERMEDLSR